MDVSRLSVAECMALGGGAGEPAKEEGLQGKLEKLVQEIGLYGRRRCLTTAVAARRKMKIMKPFLDVLGLVSAYF